MNYLYVIQIGPSYLCALHPIRYTNDFKKAKVYNSIGPARATRTKYSKILLFDNSSKEKIYFHFPKIIELKVMKNRIVN